MPVDSQSAFEFMAMAESIQCDLRKAYASVFKLLSSDICVDAVLPNCFVQDCFNFTETFFVGNTTREALANFCLFLRMLCSEFAHLAALSAKYNNCISPTVDVMLGIV